MSGPGSGSESGYESFIEAVSDTNLQDANMDDISMSGFSKASVAESIFNFEYENGRRYHSYRSGAYFAPNDEQQLQQIDLFHHVHRLVNGGELCRTKLTNPRRVLDIGTGTGIWAIEVADQFPNAEVIGIDLSPVTTPWKPSNLTFEIDDIESPWICPPNHYDFIYSRCMFGSISDWPAYISRMYNHCEPGGRVELTEATTPYQADNQPENSAMAYWFRNGTIASEMNGKPFTGVAERLEGWVREAGFVDVKVRKVRIPVGTWPKDPRQKLIGHFQLLGTFEGMEGFTLALWSRVLGHSISHIREVLHEVERELKDPHIHWWYYMYYVTAQKPLIDLPKQPSLQPEEEKWWESKPRGMEAGGSEEMSLRTTDSEMLQRQFERCLWMGEK